MTYPEGPHPSRSLLGVAFRLRITSQPNQQLGTKARALR